LPVGTGATAPGAARQRCGQGRVRRGGPTSPPVPCRLQNAYFGKQKSMLIPNTIFRCGGAVMLLSNKSIDSWCVPALGGSCVAWSRLIAWGGGGDGGGGSGREGRGRRRAVTPSAPSAPWSCGAMRQHAHQPDCFVTSRALGSSHSVGTGVPGARCSTLCAHARTPLPAAPADRAWDLNACAGAPSTRCSTWCAP